MTTTPLDLPAWTEPFQEENRPQLIRDPRFELTPPRAWLNGTGRGVTVAVVDSGIEGDHPDVGGRLVRSVRVELDGNAGRVVEDDPIDVVGHGTACAGIIHSLAPEADLVSVRVLGPKNTAKGIAFAYAMEWIIDQGVGVANLSLSSRSDDLYPAFHDLADAAYFANLVLVCAASNHPGQSSYPSTFASVISVAGHDEPDPKTWFYNPHPPVEFGAWGVDVPVAWRDGGRIVGTGNSFAAPHVAGLVTLIRSAFPSATPFEVKSILAAGARAPS